MEQNLIPSAIADNKDGMTSLEIAEVTGKEHFNVMRDIRNILKKGVNQINFELVKYTAAGARFATIQFWIVRHAADRRLTRADRRLQAEKEILRALTGHGFCQRLLCV